jgi:prolyl oligopeptidase
VKRSSLAAVLALVACRHAPAPQPATAPPVALVAPDAAPPLVDDLAAWNRAARAGAVTDTLHGVAVSDPYRALEEDTELTRTWIGQQTARSARYLAAHADPAREESLTRLSDIGALAAPTTLGGKVFYRRRNPGDEQPALVVIDTRAAGYDAAHPAASARVLIEPTRFGERAAMEWYAPSPRGRYVAFGVSQNGDERTTLRVMDLSTGALLPVAIEHTKWCRLAWLADESGFYYTRYPRESEPGFDAARPDTYWRRLYAHRLDASPDGASDPMVFEGADRTEAPSPAVSADGRWLVVNHFKGWSRSDVYLVDRRAPVAAGARPRAVPVAVGHESLNDATVYRGRLYLTTNRDAPKYRVLWAPVDALMRADAAMRATTPGTGVTALTMAPAGPWRTMIAEGPNPLEETTLAGSRMVARYLDNIVSKVRLFDLDGRPQGEVTLPSEGTVSAMGSQDDEDSVALLFTSFFVPPTVLTLDTRTAPVNGALTPALVDAPAMSVDISRYVLSRATARSADGTDINVFYMHRRDMVRDGRSAVLLNGYGGFNLAMAPSFRRQALYWLERGGVYAVANLRGGGEFGEAWHRAGARENKHHVFEDFEAAIRWFTTSGVSAPSRIAIHGGSNGGLLMGAMITRCPDAFRAAVADVGLYDMVRFHRFPPAEIWTTEYGTPESADDFRALYDYSPYHRVADHMSLPAVWVSTADHDTRVFWGHSTKFAARLQDAQAGAAPIYFYMERNVGHGAGMQRSDQVRTWTRMFTFLEDQLAVGR